MSASSPITLASLHASPIWVGWKNETPDGRAPTKVPYDPRTGRRAASDDASTWTTHDKAAQWVAMNQAAGVGLMFHQVDDVFIGGVDLDSCRDKATGDIAPWAREITNRLKSYAEVSPSGTGVKVFLTIANDDSNAVEVLFGGKHGRAFKNGGGDHPPAIEVHRGRRYFAVTNESIGPTDELRCVSLADLRWLINEAGPRFADKAKSGDGEATRGNRGDNSRSAAAWRAGAILTAQGASYEVMRDGLLEHEDPGVAEWARTKGLTNRERQMRRIFDKVGAGDKLASDSRPTIRLVAGEMDRIVDEAEVALLKANRGLYQRDNKIVFVGYSPAKAANGDDTVTIQILERGEHALLVDMAASANFEKFDKRANGWIAADPPLPIVKGLQQHGLGKLRFPTLHGVITAPTLRGDGSILNAPGYDAATGLLLDPRGVEFPAISEQPTRAEAEKALLLLDDLIKGFPFVEPHDRSVALSAILTASVRRSLPTAPLHAFSAPTAGTGKGKLVDIACVIATGFKAAPLSHGATEEEAEKRLTSKLLAGEPFIAIDNCTRPLGGELICSVLTQEKVSPRILCFSKAPPISTGAFVAANGNNLSIVGDLTRRTLRCRIDAKVEQPESRAFANDPVEDAMTRRADLVVAALTILRAYHVAGRPEKPKPLGSFEAWSDRIRGALMWLGAADPVESMNQLRKSDPEREALRSVVGQWNLVIGRNQSVTSAEIINRAVQTRSSGQQSEFVFPEFRDALMVVAGRHGILNVRALGNWLESKHDAIVDGLQIVRMGSRQGVAVWALKKHEGTDWFDEAEMLFSQVPTTEKTSAHVGWV